MTPTRAQKQQQDYSYKYSTEEGKEGRRGGFGAADYYTVHYHGSIIPTASQPIQQQRGGKSMTYSITEFNFRPYSYLVDGQKVNSVVGACFAGKTLPVLRTLLTVSGFLASGIACAGSAEGAAAAVTVREWWAAGIGLFGGAVLCWLVAGLVVVLGRLGELFEGKPPGVINVTPPDEWELEPKEEESEPALLVEQLIQPCSCLFCSPGCQGLLCPNRSASKAGAE